MEDIRAYHNLVKRQLIQNATQSGSTVLDVGCGFGGDLQKWIHAGVRTLDMCDPSADTFFVVTGGSIVPLIDAVSEYNEWT